MTRPYTPELRMQKRKPVNKSRERALNVVIRDLDKVFNKVFKSLLENEIIYKYSRR